MKSRPNLLILFSLVSLLFSCSLKETRFYSDYSGGSDPMSLAILNAVEYRTSNKADADGKFEVKSMIANLYYGVDFNGEISLLCHGYRYNSIDISLLDNLSEVVSSYEVDAAAFSLKENGILLDHAKAARAKDFHFVHSFDLSTLLPTDFDGRIYFVFRYIERHLDENNEMQERANKIKFEFDYKRDNDRYYLNLRGR